MVSATLKKIWQTYFVSPPITEETLAAARNVIEDALRSPVAVFSKSTCPYCVTATTLLKTKVKARDDLTIIQLDHRPDGHAIQQELARRIGASRVTVPQIYIKQQHMGGCSEITSLHRKGGLEPLLV